MSDEIMIVPKLSKQEQQALALYDRAPQPPLSPLVAGQFFELYLNGKSCYEIHKLNPGYSYGMVVKARLDGNWDKRLSEYRDEVLNTTMARAKMVTAQSIGFISDLLSATHKYHGQKLAKYLQTGDEKELGDLDIKSVNGYKTVLSMLAMLTQEGKPIQHNVNIGTPPPTDAPNVMNITPEVAKQLLQTVTSKTGAGNG